MEPERIAIRAFNAVDDPQRCEQYIHEHTKVLEDIGVFNALKPDTSWCTDPNVVVFVAEHPTLGMVAGIRLHKASIDDLLPMQRSLQTLDGSIISILANLVENGNAEIAGLWNAHRFAGRGVPMLLMEACVAVASRIGVGSMVTFIAEYVAPYAVFSGFEPMRSLADEGIFEYPVAGIRTHAMILNDPLVLSAAILTERHRILSLRLRPHQSRVERPKHADLLVQYDLLEPLPVPSNAHAA